MKLFETTIIPLGIIKIISLSAICTYTHFLHSNERSFHECFSEDYNFICKNPKEFLQRMNVDINQNILHMKKLHQTNKLKMGFSKGSFHADQNNIEYFVKECSLVHEFIGSRLMNLIVGTKCSPIVKLVKDKVNGIASTKLPNFVRKNAIDLENRKIIDEVTLTVVMDYIGLRDRNPKNMGYILLPSNDLQAARVDFDTSLRFKDHRWKGKHDECGHLNLKLLNESLKNFPKDQIINAIQRIVDVPDEKIVMTILECWATLDQVGHHIPFERAILFAQQLIERKNAFHKVQKSISQNSISVTKKNLLKSKEKKPVKNKNLNNK